MVSNFCSYSVRSFAVPFTADDVSCERETHIHIVVVGAVCWHCFFVAEAHSTALCSECISIWTKRPKHLCVRADGIVYTRCR